MASIINQDMLAGNNFTGVIPEASGQPVAATNLYGSSVDSFAAIEDGGLFDFFPDVSPGDSKDRFTVSLVRICLDMADATTWSLVVKRKDASGADVDFIITDETIAGGNVVDLFDMRGLAIVLPHESLVLVSAGASAAMKAQIVSTRW